MFLENRVDAVPGVPSLESLGIKGFDQKSLPSWYGRFAPAGTGMDVPSALARSYASSSREPGSVRSLSEPTARVSPAG